VRQPVGGCGSLSIGPGSEHRSGPDTRHTMRGFERPGRSRSALLQGELLAQATGTAHERRLSAPRVNFTMSNSSTGASMNGLRLADGFGGLQLFLGDLY
jgi:hypothetical protein